MMKNKMAVVMAGTMLASAVAPVVSNAAVATNTTDVNDAVALANLREELKGYFDTKYTTDTSLLLNPANAGKCVYTITVDGTEIKSVEDFDAHVNDLKKNNDKFELRIFDKGFQTEDGKIVDCESTTYGQLDANNDKKLDLDNITVDGKVDQAELLASITSENKDKQVITREVKDSSTYPGRYYIEIEDSIQAVKNLITTPVIDGNNVKFSIKAASLDPDTSLGSERYAISKEIVLTKDSKVLDFNQPIMSTVSYKESGQTQTASLLTGFKEKKVDLRSRGTLDKTITVTNAKYGVTTMTVKATDLYSEGRLTPNGNRLVKFANKVLTSAKGEFLQIPFGPSYNPATDKPIKVRDEVNATNMYKVEVSQREDLSSTQSRVVIKVKSNLGYKYENGISLFDADKNLYELTVTGTRDEVNTFITEALGLEGPEQPHQRYDRMGKIITPNAEVELLADESRYTTAVEVSKKGWPTGNLVNHGLNDLVLVSGEVTADGLAAAPLAACLNDGEGAPILLTKNGQLPMEVKREMKRLGVRNVYVVGGVISDSVKKEIESMEMFHQQDVNVITVAGNDRFDTSLEIARKIDEIGHDVDKVYIAGGYSEADTLSISALAAQQKRPVILTPQRGLTDAQVKFLKDEKLHHIGSKIVGGANSVSKNVEEQFKAMGVTIDRYDGKDRQHTNALIIDEYADYHNEYRDIENLYVVKSDNKGMVDALAAGAISSKRSTTAGMNMVVIATDSLSSDQKLALSKLDKLGGDSADKEKVKVTGKFQIGNGVADAVKSY